MKTTMWEGVPDAVTVEAEEGARRRLDVKNPYQQSSHGNLDRKGFGASMLGRDLRIRHARFQIRERFFQSL